MRKQGESHSNHSNLVLQSSNEAKHYEVPNVFSRPGETVTVVGARGERGPQLRQMPDTPVQPKPSAKRSKKCFAHEGQCKFNLRSPK